jgi:fatty acid desaturase
MNDVIYQIASFMIMRDPTIWRWSHARHHTDTIIVGRDPEMAVMRPPQLLKVAANLFGLIDVPLAFRYMVLHAAGRLSPDEARIVPQTERPKVCRTARFWLAIYAVTAALGVASASMLPALLIGLPRLHGAWLHVLFRLTQALHREMRAFCPAAYPSLLAAHREIIPTLLRQQRDPSYFIRRELPPHVRPYELALAAAA